MATETSMYIGTSSESIRMHYDSGNRFFSLWLDPYMVYSCAMWQPGDTLADAQVRKIDYFIEGTRAAGAERVFDAGCGWGGTLRRLTEDHGVKSATGVTLSEAQAEWIRGLNNPQINVHVQNWTEHEAEEPYDAIISLGAFEHFARFDCPRDEKVEQYRRFFRFCHRHLPPGGWLGLETISKSSAMNPEQIFEEANSKVFEDATFIWTHVFPESDVPWLTDVARASERRFEITSVRNDPEDYVKTLAAWQEGLRANRDEAISLVGEEVFDRHDHYLSALQRLFEIGQLGLLRFLMRRV